MTRSPKSDGGKSGEWKAGAPKIPATNSPATTSSATNSPATKVETTKAEAAKAGATKAGATKAGGARDGGHKAASPKHNSHADTRSDNPRAAKAPAAQPGVPAANVSRKANRRGAARLAAVQALYQMDMTGAGLNEILAQFESHWLGREVEGEQYLPAEAAFFRDIVSGVVNVQRDIDPRIDAALEATWPLKRIQAILRSVLRAGAYELEKRTDIPARVVVSEYVDVAHAFVDKSETGMVNAVLDRLARNARAAEFG